jgi:hypothetical protein
MIEQNTPHNVAMQMDGFAVSGYGSGLKNTPKGPKMTL